MTLCMNSEFMSEYFTIFALLIAFTSDLIAKIYNEIFKNIQY